MCGNQTRWGYSGYDKQAGTGEERTLSAKGKTFLRGTQFTDDSGAVTFKTIYPSWYTGRTPHIHFKVFIGRDPVRDTFNANDTYLRNGMLGVMCNVRRKGHGYRATVDVGVEKA